jgi:membrane associated rhomboid family serine protease
MAQTAETGGVAYAAHVGGFLAGLALVWLFRKRGPQAYARAS